MNPREVLEPWLRHSSGCRGACAWGHLTCTPADLCTCGLNAALADLEAEGRPMLTEEPPPFGSVPFGTMFVPGGGFIRGDNEWHEFPGPLELPPRPTPLSDEELATMNHAAGLSEYLARGGDQAFSTVDRLLAIIDRLAATPEATEERSDA